MVQLSVIRNISKLLAIRVSFSKVSTRHNNSYIAKCLGTFSMYLYHFFTKPMILNANILYSYYDQKVLLILCLRVINKLQFCIQVLEI